MRSLVGDIGGNLSKMNAFVHEAVERQVDILCFPELSITGYSSRADIKDVALSRESPAVKEVIDLAKTNGLTILAGLAEREEEAVYATHLVASASGVLGYYRKLHLAHPEAAVFTPGDDIPLFHACGSFFGLQLCYDAHFPELSAVQALKGADVLFIPHASPHRSPEQKLESWLRHLTARAFDNGVFVLACNLVGDNGAGLTFPGTAVIVSPEGRILNSYAGDSEFLLTAELRADELQAVRSHQMRYFLPHRRPELYEELVRKGAKVTSN